MQKHKLQLDFIFLLLRNSIPCAIDQKVIEQEGAYRQFRKLITDRRNASNVKVTQISNATFYIQGYDFSKKVNTS